MLIHIPMHNGELLRQEVLEGIIANECDTRVITSELWGKDTERNKAQNVSNMLRHIKEDYFILMDSDVVLPTGCIKAMAEELMNSAIVCIPTKPIHTEGAYFRKEVFAHACMMMRREMVETFSRYLDTGGCFVCNFLRDYPAKILWEQRGYEV